MQVLCAGDQPAWSPPTLIASSVMTQRSSAAEMPHLLRRTLCSTLAKYRDITRSEHSLCFRRA